ALLVLVGAGLVIRSLRRLERVDPGFRAEGVLTFHAFLSPGRYAKDPQRAAVAARLGERFGALPRGSSAGLGNYPPPRAVRVMIAAQVENRRAAPTQAPPQVDWRSASPGYLEALAIPLLAGRTFTAADAAGTLPVAVVDDSLAARFWPGESAL